MISEGAHSEDIPTRVAGREDVAASGRDLRVAYEATRLIGVRRGAFLYCLIGVALMLATAVLDPVRYPNRAAALLHVRLLSAGVLAVTLVLLAGRLGRLHPHALGLFAATAAGVALRALELVVRGGVSPFDIGTSFSMLGVPLLIPWAAGWTGLACLHIIVSHLASPLAGAPLGPAFTKDLIFFASAGAVAIAIATSLERRRWSDFVQRHSLVDAHRQAHASAERYRLAVEALRESEARLRAVIDSSPVVLFALDSAGTITFSGGRGLTRLGLDPAQFLGKPVADLLRERFPHAQAHFERALAGEQVVWQGSIDETTFETRLTPLRDASGAVSGVIGLATDVSDRREAEDARLSLERKLLEGQRLESLGLLAGGIAHDFNNLLGTILGNAARVLADIPSGSARVSVERIEQAARRGSDLTRQLLAYAGEGEIAPEAVDVNALARETRDLLAVSLPANVSLRLTLDPALPALRADPTQLRQVLMNLVLNGAEAMRGRAGEVTVRTGREHVDDEALRATQHAPDAVAGPHLVLEVSDNGCGMDAATLAKVFDPFFSTKRSGRGLGLASVLGIVRGHRGALAVSSEPGRGTTFRVLLPWEEAAAARPASRPTAPPAAQVSRTVLLVDDEEDVRAVTAHMLERLGCAVLVAGDGQEGVRVFRSNAQLIDAVVIDLTLPRLSGDRAAQEIRRIRPGAPVILMSGRIDENARARLAAESSVGFLRKPFSAADLRSMMDNLLTERR